MKLLQSDLKAKAATSLEFVLLQNGLQHLYRKLSCNSFERNGSLKAKFSLRIGKANEPLAALMGERLELMNSKHLSRGGEAGLGK